MFSKSSLERLTNLFAEQFERDGAGFLYRRTAKSAPIRVSEAERNDFVADYRRRLRNAGWVMLPVTVLVIVLVALLSQHFGEMASRIATFAAVAVILAPFLLLQRHARGAPARALSGRLPEGRERTREEVRRWHLGRITYTQLAFLFAFAAVLACKSAAQGDMIHGSGLLWLVAAMATAGLALVQGIRKRIYDRD